MSLADQIRKIEEENSSLKETVRRLEEMLTQMSDHSSPSSKTNGKSNVQSVFWFIHDKCMRKYFCGMRKNPARWNSGPQEAKRFFTKDDALKSLEILRDCYRRSGLDDSSLVLRIVADESD